MSTNPDTHSFPGDPSLVTGQYYTLVTFSLYPFSRGHVHITGPKIDDTIDFDPGILSDAKGLDVKNHVWMYKKQLEIARRMEVFRGPAFDLPAFKPGSKAAAALRASSPVGTDEPDVEYTAEDDEALAQWVRGHANSTWHPIGTCKMAPRERNGVVDPALNVHGVQGLKVADLSIPPSNIGCNTCSVALGIAEKAADIFIKELGLRK